MVCQVALALAICHAADSGDFFETKVRPVFARNCYACHAESHMGGLRLDSAEGIRKGGQSGPLLVPGRPDDSLLIKVIQQTDARFKMPPGGKLRVEEISAIVDWVKAGAIWPATVTATPSPAGVGYVITPEQRSFWAFQPIRKPGIPQVRSAGLQSPIDALVLAKLEEKGLNPRLPSTNVYSFAAQHWISSGCRPRRKKSIPS